MPIPGVAQMPGLLNAGGLLPITLAYKDSAQSGSNLSTYTFSDMAIGTATSDRLVIFGFVSTDQSGNPGDIPTGVTIGGEDATLLASFAAPSTLRHGLSLWWVALATGTTATVVITLPDTQVRAAGGTFIVTGGRTHISSQSDNGDADIGTTPNTTISYNPNAVGIVCIITILSLSSYTFDLNCDSSFIDLSFDSAGGSFAFGIITGGSAVGVTLNNTRTHGILACMFG